MESPTSTEPPTRSPVTLTSRTGPSGRRGCTAETPQILQLVKRLWGLKSWVVRGPVIAWAQPLFPFPKLGQPRP